MSTTRSIGLVLLLNAVVVAQTPVGTAFTYQGQLKQSGIPLTGTADFQFSLWDAAAGGQQVGVTVPVNAVNVQAGLFTVVLDFGGAAFDGNARWLEIAVRAPSGSGTFTPLSPRQAQTAAPYALYALSGPGSGGFWAGNGANIYATNAGNIGIGTSTPLDKLRVIGTHNSYRKKADALRLFFRFGKPRPDSETAANSDI